VAKSREVNELMRLKAEMSDFLDAVDQSGRKGFNSEQRERWNRMLARHDELETMVARASLNRPGSLAPDRIAYADPQDPEGFEFENFGLRLTPGEQRARAKDPHARAFSNFLRRGVNALSEDERSLMRHRLNNDSPAIRNAQSGAVGSQGGYLIPQGFSDILTEAMKWFGGIDGVAGEFHTENGAPLPWPLVNDATNKGRLIGQNVQAAETDFAFGATTTFNAYIFSSDIVLIPIALLEDSYFDLDAFTARALGTRIGRQLNYQGTVGTGSGAPTGIVTAAVAAGNVMQLTTGNTASIAYSNLVTLEHTVDPAYRFNPKTRWMFSDAMLKLIKLLVDANDRPLWQPGLSSSFREGAAVDLLAAKPTILDHPYIINQDMATPASGAYTILFGDMSLYQLRRVAGGVTVQRLVERYADYLQVGFQAFARFDAQLVDAGTHPIAVLQQSAA
jgi:HK97 family phage major capsid protein